MSKLETGDGRTHIKSKLMRESLQDRGVIAGTDSGEDLKIFPDVNLVRIGGQSIFDRGRAAILPLAKELGEIHGKGDKRRTLEFAQHQTRITHAILSVAI